MSSALAEAAVQEGVASEPMTWEVRLGDVQPQKRVVVFLVALTAGLLGIILLKQIVFGVVGSLVILFSTAELFLPIRYRLDQNGASATVGLSRTEVLWPSVKQMQEEENGIKLSPLAKSGSRLDAFRGVYLRFAGNKDEVLAKIRQFRGDL